LSDFPEITEDENLPIDKKANQELENLLKRNKRQEEMENVAHRITIFILWAVIITLTIVGLIRISFLVLPVKYEWLTGEQINYIDEFFIHGTIGAILIEFLKKRLSKKE